MFQLPFGFVHGALNLCRNHNKAGGWASETWTLLSEGVSRLQTPKPGLSQYTRMGHEILSLIELADLYETTVLRTTIAIISRPLPQLVEGNKVTFPRLFDRRMRLR